MKLLVLGASGGCGRWFCRLALARGHQVHALVRPTTVFDPPAGTDVIRGDVLAAGMLDRLVEECDAVISALGIKRQAPWNPWSALASPPDLCTRVAESLVAVMPRHNVRRVVVISAAGVGGSIRHVHPLLRWMIRHSTMAASYADLAGMEAVLAGSGLDWLAVRPTTLTAGSPTGKVRVVEHYGLTSRIARGDVAAWMLNALEGPELFEARTPMISS